MNQTPGLARLPHRPGLHPTVFMKKTKSKTALHRQLNLFKKDLRFFGGRLLHGKRKGRRPLSTKEPIHLVLRSSWAMGQNSFLRPQNKRPIESLIASLSRKYGVTLYQRAIASNHLHLLVRIECRKSYVAFIKVLSSKIALHVMKNQNFKIFKKSLRDHIVLRPNTMARSTAGGDGANTTEIQGKGQKFWQFRPFNRVLTWGRDFKGCTQYVIQNKLEAIGFIKYKARNSSYAKWIAGGVGPSSA
jgi:REP element-mobilizing transposase RayT